MKAMLLSVSLCAAFVAFGDARTDYMEVYRSLDTNRAMSRLERLWRHEVGQTMSCRRRAAETVVGYLREDGFSAVESVELPTDGRTSFQDKRMPFAWEATVGRLTIADAGKFVSAGNRWDTPVATDGVLADYRVHPFHLVKGSVSTPPGGLDVKVLSEAQFLAGEDAKGALVMLEPETWPRARMLTPILDRGGLGFICDQIVDRFETPDSVQWVTACTETSSWSCDEETRPFVGFSVSPRTGTRLRSMAGAGGFTAHVECDGRRVATTMPFVTATVPGRSAKEFWIVSHMYEPLASDDSCGVVAAIELARRFIGPEKPAYTIRVLFGIEYYGYAAYLDRLGCPLRDRVIGAVNLDSIPCQRGNFLNVLLGGPATPFCGNLVIESLARALEGRPDTLKFDIARFGDYFDDYFMADPTVGVPMTGTLYGFLGARYWHNSRMDIDFIDAETYRRGMAFAGTFVAKMANPSAASVPSALALAKDRLARAAKEAGNAEHFAHLADVERRHLADFDRVVGAGTATAALAEFDACAAALAKTVGNAPLPDSPWRRYAAGIVPSRKLIGFTQDLTRVPREERIRIPGEVIYAPLGNAVANMDGKKDLARLIREAEYERVQTLSEDEVASYVRAVCFLADWGYFSLSNAGELGADDVVKALAAAGVKKGDLVLADADLDRIGHVAGGFDAVLKALREAVGPTGTVLLPAFTPSVRICREVNRSWDYRPFDPKDLASVAKASPLTAAFLRGNPSAPRSAHVARSWTGFGPLAADCLGAQRPDSAPYGDDSPLARALRRGGKFVHIGSAPDAAELGRFLAVRRGKCACTTAVVGVRDPDGSSHDVFVPGWPVGAKAPALPPSVRVSRAPLGLGEVGVADPGGMRPEITWSVMHPVAIDVDYMRRVIDKAREYGDVDSFEVCGLEQKGVNALIGFERYPHAAAHVDRAFVERTRAALNAVCDLAHQAGKRAYFWHRENLVPQGIFEDVPGLLDADGEFDLLGSDYLDYLRYKIDSTFASCPGLDGLVLTLTESEYSVIHNSNQVRYPPERVVQTLVGLFVRELSRRGKRFILRSFGDGDDHEKIINGALAAARETGIDFEIETKVTEADFVPWLPRNKYLKRDAPLDLGAECDAHGEYLGAGYLPAAQVARIGEYVRSAREEGASRYAIRIDRKGFSIFDSAQEVNLYAYMRFIRDPGATADEVIADFARQRFGAAAPRMAKVLKDELEMVRNINYVASNLTFHAFPTPSDIRLVKAGGAFGLYREGEPLEPLKEIWSILWEQRAPTHARILEEKDRGLALAEEGLRTVESLKGELSPGEYERQHRAFANAVVLAKAFRVYTRCVVAYFEEMAARRDDPVRLLKESAEAQKTIAALKGGTMDVPYLNGIGFLCGELVREYRLERAMRAKVERPGVCDYVLPGCIGDDGRVSRIMHAALPETREDCIVRYAGNNRFPIGWITVRLKAPQDADIRVGLDPSGAPDCTVRKTWADGVWTVTVTKKPGLDYPAVREIVAILRAR